VFSDSVLWLGLLLRALCGLAIGVYSVIVPLYLVELSPPESTGFFGTLHQLGIAVGFVICSAWALVHVGFAALARICASIPALHELTALLMPGDVEGVGS
jgi:MFS family permease